MSTDSFVFIRTEFCTYRKSFWHFVFLEYWDLAEGNNRSVYFFLSVISQLCVCFMYKVGLEMLNSKLFRMHHIFGLVWL